MIGIAGPPGAGKSTLAQALKAVLGREAVVVPMDGFHFPNARLDALGLRARKGAPETFDRLAFELAVAELRATQKPVSLPLYSRELHEPVADALTVPLATSFVIVEGNYLFLWPEVRNALDLKIYLDCDPALARASVIARHQQGGASEEEAVRKFETNDRLNSETVHATRGAAEIMIRRNAAGWTVERVGGT
ncbi:MAG: nucleoside/nucleotide kinase family protein [Verrucomicrobiae bacterium]|nr:nucleoside/nucleotide kinase family protein [Verrucomicrobiae bacterium]